MTPLASRVLRHVLIFAAVLMVLVLGMRGWLGVRSGQKMTQALARAAEHWGAPGADPAAPPAVPDEENAAVALRGAVAAHGLPTSSLAAINRFKARRGDVPAERTVLQATVDNNAEALSLLDAALDLPVIDWRVQAPAGSHQPAGSAPVTLLISLATTNWVSGMLASADEKPAAALVAIRRQLLLARSLGDEAELMSQVVRLRILSGALDLVKEILIRTAIDEEVLRRLQDELQALSGREILRQALITEFKEMVRHHLALDRDGEAGEGAVRRWLLRPVVRSRLTHDIEHFSSLLTWVETPRFKRAAEGESAPPLPLGDSRWRGRVFPDRRLGAQLLDLADLVDARLVLARTAVSLCLQKTSMGAYPGSLDAAPLDPLTGEPPLYQAVGDGFLLESGRKEFEAQATRSEPWGPTGLLSWQILQ